MRLTTLTLCILLAGLIGCSKPWSNPDVRNDRQAQAQFRDDSVACEVVAGEQYPLDKNKQIEVYDQCMIDKGWKRERRGDGIPVNLRK